MEKLNFVELKKKKEEIFYLRLLFSFTFTPENFPKVSEGNNDSVNRNNFSEKGKIFFVDFKFKFKIFDFLNFLFTIDIKENNSDRINDSSEVNASNSSSTGRTSPSNPDNVFNLDLSNLSLKEKSTNKRMNKGFDKETNNPSSDDPLSLLDPLWTMKKEK